MKKLLFVFYLFLFVFSATAQSKDVPTSLPDIVNELQTKFNVSISYDADMKVEISQEKKTDILQQTTIEQALDKLTKTANLQYKKLRSDYYVITKKITTGFIPSPPQNQSTQERTITGVVYNEEGKTLPGATVAEKGTNNATITDLDGKFKLQISDNATTLIVNFIGYKQQEVSLSSDKDFYEIYLEADNFNLEAVVVSGVAGKTPAKKLTITVNHLDAEQFKEAPPSSAATSLQGKIPGITVVSASGSPGSNTAIRMRGVTSLNGNNAPLIIVDGIMTETYLSDFNADDIESIEVVKGAAASALYGSKAAGGVIVITTKRGKNIEEDYQVIVRNEFGQSSITKYLDLATHHPYQLADDYEQYPYTRYANIIYDEDGNIIGGSQILTDSGYADQPYALVQNLQKQFFKKGNYYTNYVGISTKSKESNLFLSFENHHKEGILNFKKGYTRQNFRFNADTKVGKYIKISTSNLLINANRDLYSYNPFDDLIRMNPDVNLFAENDDGTPYRAFPDPYNNKIRNPYYLLYNTKYQKQKLSFLTNINTTVHLTNWLNFNAKYTLEKLNSNFHQYEPIGFIENDTTTSNGYLSETNIRSMYQTAQATLNFNETFGDFLVKSKLSYMYEDKSYHSSNMYTNELQVPGIEEFTNAASNSINASSYSYTIRAIDYFAIADIDYKSKYLFSGLFRRDGSSLFGANARWNNYFRVAGAYRITEDFSIPGIQELKIRTAYGTSGLRPGFSWQYETYTIYNGNLSKAQLGNKNLKPAEAKELEFALDAEFLKIFNFTASYSRTKTLGAFVNIPLPSTLGFTSQWTNAADLFSDAIELSLGALVYDKNNTRISFQVNFDKIRQKVDTLRTLPYYTGPNSAYYIASGETFGVLYGYKWVRSLDDMAKQLPEGRTIDDYTINSDGYVILKGTEGSHYEKPIILDTTDNGVLDKYLIGDGNPKFHLTFSSNMKFHRFSFYFLIDWKNGGDVYNYTRQELFIDNKAAIIDQYGKPEDQKKYIGYYSEFYGGQINEYFVEDGSYVKIRELSAYYTLNLNKNFLKSMKVGVIANNLYTFTKYSGYDPEVAYSGDLTTFAFDLNSYPHYRTISASLQFEF